MKHLIKYTRNTLVACMLVIFLTGIASALEMHPWVLWTTAIVAVIYITVRTIQFFIEKNNLKTRSHEQETTRRTD